MKPSFPSSPRFSQPSPALPAFASAASSRREFLRLLALTTASPLAAGPLIAQVRETPQAKKPLKILIAGAGLAGLCAAYELEKLGHECVILEADGSHIGGRTRTLRFQDGLYGEAGAMRVPESHQVTRHYLKELGVALRPFITSNPEAYYHLRGKTVRIKDVEQLKPLFKLTDREKGMTPAAIWDTTVVSRLKKMSPEERAQLLAPAFSTPAMRTLDQQSLQQLFEADGFSQEAIEMLAVTFGQDAIMGSAATEHLREEMENVWNLSFDEIEGGTDRFPAAFVEKLKNKPRLGCEIIRIEQAGDGKRAAVIYRDRGVDKAGKKDGQDASGGVVRGAAEEKREEGDFLICTLPCPVLGRIQTPHFSGEKMRSIRQLIYDSSTKVLALTQNRFWEIEDGIYGGGTFTDLPTASTYYPASNAKGKDPAVSAKPSIFLASYSWGQQARRLGALEPSAQREVVLSQLSKVHPQLLKPGVVTRTVGWSWDRHPWSGGAFAWFNPGQHSALYQNLIAPEGRIHFAGEHASLAHTWMQGALESALRVVKEITIAGRA